MSKRKVLVCGATGFIGRNVAESLARRDDFEVTGIHLNREPYKNSDIKWIKADLRRDDEARKAVQGQDVVIHAAATTSGSRDIVNTPSLHVTDNAVMGSHLFRAMHDLGVPQSIFFSCSVMYQPIDRPVKETDFDANTEIAQAYFGVGTTKVYLENVAKFFARQGKTKHTVLRHSNIYGPHDKYDLKKSHVFGATLTKVLTSKGEEVSVWGTGEERRDLMHVSDLVDLVERIVDKPQEPKFGLYNAGSGKGIAVRDLVQEVITQSGRNLRIVYDTSQPTIPIHQAALDSTLAYETFGWKPKVSLNEGIIKTIRWYQENYGK